MKINYILIVLLLLNFSSLQAVGENELLSVQVELFEAMPTKKQVKAPKASDAAGAKQEPLNDDAIGPLNDDAVESLNNDDAMLPRDELDHKPAPLKDPDKIYLSRAFGFHRLPFKYDETGVRELHKGPILFRATATLTLAKGSHRILIRTRNDAKFMMDGEVLATLKTLPESRDGHNPVIKIPDLVSPTVKYFAPGNIGKVISLFADGLSHTFTLETIVGDSKRRPDTGDLAVAIAGPGEETFTLLGSDKKIVFSNEGWAEYVEDAEARYVVMDRRERRMRSLKETQY